MAAAIAVTAMAEEDFLAEEGSQEVEVVFRVVGEAFRVVVVLGVAVLEAGCQAVRAVVVAIEAAVAASILRICLVALTATTTR